MHRTTKCRSLAVGPSTRCRFAAYAGYPSGGKGGGVYPLLRARSCLCDPRWQWHGMMGGSGGSRPGISRIPPSTCSPSSRPPRTSLVAGAAMIWQCPRGIARGSTFALLLALFISPAGSFSIPSLGHPKSSWAQSDGFLGTRWQWRSSSSSSSSSSILCPAQQLDRSASFRRELGVSSLSMRQRRPFAVVVASWIVERILKRVTTRTNDLRVLVDAKSSMSLLNGEVRGVSAHSYAPHLAAGPSYLDDQTTVHKPQISDPKPKTPL
jgi:hypothetical protein